MYGSYNIWTYGKLGELCKMHQEFGATLHQRIWWNAMVGKMPVPIQPLPGMPFGIAFYWSLSEISGID